MFRLWDQALNQALTRSPRADLPNRRFGWKADLQIFSLSKVNAKWPAQMDNTAELNADDALARRFGLLQISPSRSRNLRLGLLHFRLKCCRNLR